MNKNPENNAENNDIDDILEILNKKREADKKNQVDDAPTRVTSTIIVPDKAAFNTTPKKQEQASMFEEDMFKSAGDLTPSSNSSTAEIKVDEVKNGINEKNNGAFSDKASDSPKTEIVTDKPSSEGAENDKSSETIKKEADQPQTEKATVSTTDVSKSDESKPAATEEKNDVAKPVPSVSTTFTVFSNEEKKDTKPSIVPKPNPAPAKPVNKPQMPSKPLSPAPSKPLQTKPSGAVSPSKPKPRGNYDSMPKVSLSDFDSIATKPKKKKSKNQNKVYVPGYVKVIIYLLVVISVSIFISASIISVSNDVFALNKDEKEITVNIKEDATVDEVARELKDKGVISYPGIYKLYLKFRADGSMDGKFLEGEHVLNSDMNYEQIIKLLSVPNVTSEIVRVTIPEGYTVYELLDLLEEKKVIDKEGRAKMIEKLNDTSYFDYDFLPEMPETVTNDDGTTSLDTEKFYLLEGYLFPDTYDFYVGENIDSILSKFLENFDSKFDETFYERCDELGMTIDEVITLASMIQAEGNNSQDFYYISNVFHNRLNSPANYPKLESDATTVYAFQGTKDRNKLTADDIKLYDSPYNTYLNNGLPPGPVCNPGHDAIYAALYPRYTRTETDEQGNSREYSVEYYFFYTSGSTGITYFSSTLDEHNRYIQADINSNS